MRLSKILFGGLLALCLATFAVPAQAATLQRFWVVNYTDMNIYQVFVNGKSKDLMGENGVLYYNPRKVPDLVQVLRPRPGSCNATVEIVAGYEDEDYEYTAYKRINLCTPDQTLNVFQGDFN